MWCYYSILADILQFESFCDIITSELILERLIRFMNEATILANARATSGVFQNVKDLKGHLVRITRIRSKAGMPDFLKEAEGVVVDVTLSCIVIHRSDIVSDKGYNHPQLITYTFSDFLTGLYEYEVIA